MTREDRFWSHTVPEPNTGCILWTATCGRRGYGLFWDGTKLAVAHRYAWLITNGPIAQGLNVCHKCDTCSCVNPDHLFLGTQKQNMHDMIAKGRKVVVRGENSKHAKLNEERVREIRNSRLSWRAFEAKYGVSQGTVSDVRCGRTWKHVA